MQSTRNGNSTKVIANHGEGAVRLITKHGDNAAELQLTGMLGF